MQVNGFTALLVALALCLITLPGTFGAGHWFSIYKCGYDSLTSKKIFDEAVARKKNIIDGSEAINNLKAELQQLQQLLPPEQTNAGEDKSIKDKQAEVLSAEQANADLQKEREDLLKTIFNTKEAWRIHGLWPNEDDINSLLSQRTPKVAQCTAQMSENLFNWGRSFHHVSTPVNQHENGNTILFFASAQEPFQLQHAGITIPNPVPFTQCSANRRAISLLHEWQKHGSFLPSACKKLQQPGFQGLTTRGMANTIAPLIASYAKMEVDLFADSVTLCEKIVSENYFPTDSRSPVYFTEAGECRVLLYYDAKNTKFTIHNSAASFTPPQQSKPASQQGKPASQQGKPASQQGKPPSQQGTLNAEAAPFTPQSLLGSSGNNHQAQLSGTINLNGGGGSQVKGTKPTKFLSLQERIRKHIADQSPSPHIAPSGVRT